MDFKRFFGENRHLVVLAVAIVVFYLFFFHNRLYGEINGSFISYGFVMEQQPLPFWSAQLSGGYPLFSNGEIPVFGLFNIILFFVNDVVLAFGLSILASMLFAGIGAALLAHEFIGNRFASVFAGVVFVATGSFAYALFSGTMPYLYPLAFYPLVFLFSYRAVHGSFFRNSAFAALFLAFGLLSGGTIYFLWNIFGVAVFLSVYGLFALLRFDRSRLFKICAAVAVIFVLAVGFSAVKLLPAYEFNKLTNRADSVSYDEFVWRHTQITLFKIPGALFGTGFGMMRMGVVVFLLAAASLLALKRKHVFAFAFLAVVALLVEATPLSRLVYALPGFDKMRQIYNVLGLFSVAVSVLSAVGFAGILRRFKSKRHVIGVLIIALAVAELFVVGYHTNVSPYEKNFGRQLGDNALLLNISGDSDYYRLHFYGENFVGLSIAKYAVPLGIRVMDWTTGNVWFNDYSQFTGVAGQQNSARMWGVANVKYVASRQPLDIPGLEFAGSFKECVSCDLKASYLYKNRFFLPEAYTVKKAVLVFGSSVKAEQLQYQLLLEPSFNPVETAVILSGSLPENLERFGLVLLTENPQDSGRLAAYAAGGGIVEPDVLSGKTAADFGRVLSYLSSEVPVAGLPEINEYAPGRIKVTAKDDGFLVLSEKFYKFRDWKAHVGVFEPEKFRSNIISTSVYLKKGESVVFEYKPASFRIGLVISVISVIAAFSPLLLMRLRRRFKQRTRS
ncbi:hypothetical protein HYU12_02880 [Candidatus Woesearchaeota archaeon]|nr:hypothetical protein [Candidatus Woesearchaeota archaeon]